MRSLRIAVVTLVVLVLLISMWISISLAGSGFTQPYSPPAPVPSPNGIDPLPCPSPYDTASMIVFFIPDTDDDGSGNDWTAAVARRNDGSVISVRYYSIPEVYASFTDFYSFTLGTAFDDIAWLEVYDITYGAVVGPAPNSEYSRIRASAPTPVIRTRFDMADFLAPGCVVRDTVSDNPVPLPPDNRLNWNQGDLLAVAYSGTDSSGAPAMHVYRVNNDSQGVFLFSITQADLAPYQNAPPPASNTLLKTFGDVALYRLVSGEFALVIGPDAEGKNWQMIFDGIPWTTLHYAHFDPGE
ncbi:MAG: hypothetical protein H6672_00625 [Anaerolineaceae bacterium]|nr:hypothetical protein [Anaerolineaceae bacterium]